MTISRFILIAGAGCILAQSAAQARQDKTLSANVTIKSSGGTTAIHGKTTASPPEEFLFCVDLDRSSPQSVEFAGPARVVYRPMPPPPMPQGMVVSGPEMVASTLAVIAEDGRAWVFVEKGQKAILPSGDRALTNATTVNVNLVRRTDWAPANSRTRRGTDIQGCLAPAG